MVNNLIHKRVYEWLKEDQWPIIDSIIFSDGSMILLELERKYSSNEYISSTIRTLCDSTSDSYSKYNNQDWLTTLNELYRFNNKKLEILIGEGSHGSEGSITAINFNTKDFLWRIYFQNSNPFIEGNFKDDFLFIKNNLEQVWKIDVNKPWIIEIDNENCF